MKTCFGGHYHRMTPEKQYIGIAIRRFMFLRNFKFSLSGSLRLIGDFKGYYMTLPGYKVVFDVN